MAQGKLTAGAPDLADGVAPASRRQVGYAPYKVLAARLLELGGSLLTPVLASGGRRQAEHAPSRVVLIEPFGLGDLVVMTGMIAPLRERFPGVHVGLVCHERWRDFASKFPGVDAVHAHAFPWSTSPKRLTTAGVRNLLGFLRTLRSERYDTGVDIRGDVRSQLLLVAIGCTERVGFTDYMGSNIRLRGMLLTRKTSCGVRPRLDELRSLLVELDARPHAELRMAIGRAAIPNQRGQGLRIGIHLGAGWEPRKWPTERWRELLAVVSAEREVEFVLLGTPSERTELEFVAGGAPDCSRVRVTSSVEDLVSQIGSLDLLVCHDSAPLHIAAAQNVPAVALFGPGVITRWSHPGAPIAAIHHQERFACAPCAQLRCVHPGASCVTAIQVSEVQQALASLLAS